MGRPVAEDVRVAEGGERVVECLFAPLPGDSASVAVVVRDVTAARRAEAALRDSERRFRSLAEGSSDMITRHDPAGVYVYVSPACRSLVGFEPAELLGRSPHEFIHTDDLPEVHRAHLLMLSSSGASTVAFRGLRRDGSYVWLESTLKAEREPVTGRVLEVHCATRDVTRRKLAEQEMRESREVLQSVLDNSPAVVYIKDLEGRYLLINRRYETLFGVDRRQFVGRTDNDLFPPERAEALRGNDRKVIEAGVPLEFEEVVPHGGETHTYLSVKFPLTERDGSPYAVCGISTDITERFHAEDALRKTSAVLQSILDNMADAVVVADEHERFLVFNPAAQRMFGRGPSDTTRQEWSRHYGLFLPDAVTPFPSEQIPLSRTLRGESVNDVEIFVRHEGKPEGIWVIVSGRPLIDDRGQLRGGMVVCHDITERKLAEERLRVQNHRLQEVAELERQAHEALKLAEVQLVQAEKLAALGLIVAGVAHEVNNPLSFVSNNMAVLQRDLLAMRKVVTAYQEADAVIGTHAPATFDHIRTLTDALDLDYTLENLDRLIARTREGLRRIQQIVKDLKDFVRPDEGDCQSVDLNPGIASTVNIVHGLARNRGIEIDTDLHPLPSVTCHSGKVNQVVMNLLSNAIDACEAGGRVVVHTEVAPEADGVFIAVSDNGQGIAPEIRERIFDPFFTTKPVGHGTGLGLSISYGIVKAHGGRITVQSQPGHGSTFTIWLPLAPPTPALPAP
jgi:two-component system, NtrC family, sensor kinase